MALIALVAALVVVLGVVYFFVVKLKMGGTDAIRMRAAPATGAGPSVEGLGDRQSVCVRRSFLRRGVKMATRTPTPMEETTKSMK